QTSAWWLRVQRAVRPGRVWFRTVRRIAVRADAPSHAVSLRGVVIVSLQDEQAPGAALPTSGNVTRMPEPATPIALPPINIVVRDMQKSIAFSRLLGVTLDDMQGAPEWAEWARHHVNGTASNGVRVELDSIAFA